MTEWKAKSPATENWDDDYLFQTLAPSASLPAAIITNTSSSHYSGVKASATSYIPTPGGFADSSELGNGGIPRAVTDAELAEGVANPGLGLGMGDRSDQDDDREPARSPSFTNLPVVLGGDDDREASDESADLDWDAEDAISSTVPELGVPPLAGSGGGFNGVDDASLMAMGSPLRSDITSGASNLNGKTRQEVTSAANQPRQRISHMDPHSHPSALPPSATHHRSPQSLLASGSTALPLPQISPQRRSFHVHRSSSTQRTPPPRTLAIRPEQSRQNGTLHDGSGMEYTRNQQDDPTVARGTIRPKTTSTLGFFGGGGRREKLVGSGTTEGAAHGRNAPQMLVKGHGRSKSGHTRRSSQPFAISSKQGTREGRDPPPITPSRTSSYISDGRPSTENTNSITTSPSPSAGEGAHKLGKPKLMSRISSFHKRLSGSTIGIPSPTKSSVGDVSTSSPRRTLSTHKEVQLAAAGLPRSGLSVGGPPGMSRSGRSSLEEMIPSRTATTKGEASARTDVGISDSPSPMRVQGGLATWSYPRMPSTMNGYSGEGASPPGVPRRSSSRSDLTRSPVSMLETPPVPPLPIPHRTTSRVTDRSSISSASVNVQPRPLPPSTSMTSLGFHLPSPNPGSPYHPANTGSFSPDGYFADDFEVATPKRTRIRPTSHVPTATLRSESPSGPRAARSETTQSVAGPERRSASPPEPSRSTIGLYPWENQMPTAVQEVSQNLPTSTPTALSQSRSTMKRLGSISKRHGRKLSDGWRLASGSSARSTDTMTSPPMMTTAVMPEVPSERAAPRLQPRIRQNALPPSASMPLASLSPHASVVPLRSLSQNDSPSNSRTSTRTEDVIEEPIVTPRRNSLSDLRIPATVARAQAGLKRGLVAVKRFAEGVEDLKVLLNKRDEMRRQGIDFPSGPDDETWWDMATLLVQLGENPIDGDDNTTCSARPLPNSDMKRDRRVTLAATARRPNSPITSSANKDAISRPQPPSSSHNLAPPVRNEAWRASTGRRDLTPTQLDALRQILNKSDDRHVPDASQSASGLQGPQRLAVQNKGMDTSDLQVALPPTDMSNFSFYKSPGGKSPSIGKQQQRKGSRSALSAFREFIKPTSAGTKVAPQPARSEATSYERPEAQYPERSRHSKTQSRPSLASVFRKSSSNFSLSNTHPLGSSMSSASTAAPTWRVEEEDGSTHGTAALNGSRSEATDLPPIALGSFYAPASTPSPLGKSGSIAGRTDKTASTPGSWSASSMLSIKRALQEDTAEERVVGGGPLLVTPDRLPALTEQVECVRETLKGFLARAL